MMLHGSQSPTPGHSPTPPHHQSPFALPPPPASSTTTTTTTATSTSPHTTKRKRKAETQDNERLSKRLSLLNIGNILNLVTTLKPSRTNTVQPEQNGSKLYVPVEAPSNPIVDNSTTAQPTIDSANPDDVDDDEDLFNGGSYNYDDDDDDIMRLDDTKHKVYIYNIDDELSSDDDTPDANDGRLVFLPDIEAHLKANRIPPHILANSDGQLAGMQMVLYSEPKSLTVPEEKDGVRRAVIEARRRLRNEQGQQGGPDPNPKTADSISTSPSSSPRDSMATENDGRDSPDAMDMD